MTISPSETPVPAGRPTAAPLPRVISAVEMNELVRSGRAYQWDIPLDGEMPLVTLVDGVWVETDDGWTLQSGEWYSVFVDRHDGAYEIVDDEAARAFTDFYARLRVADQASAQQPDGKAETAQDVASAGHTVAVEPTQPPPDDVSLR